MNKKLKKALLTGASFLMLASVGASMNSVNSNARHVRTHRSAWHTGTPSVFHKNSFWISSYRKYRKSPKFRYVRLATPFSYKYGYNPIPSYYNRSKHFTLNGADSSATGSIHSRYRSLGHGWYQMRDQLTAYLVKVHNRHNASIWIYEGGHKHYEGDFHQYAHRDRTLKRVLKW